jgi:anti-anti-sigma regulatory factor
VTNSANEGDRYLRLPPDCSIAAIRSVCDLVREALARETRPDDRLEIDCSDVEHADVTSVQLLLATAKSANLRGRPIMMTAISKTLSSTFTRAGVTADVMADHNLPRDTDER